MEDAILGSSTEIYSENALKDQTTQINTNDNGLPSFSLAPTDKAKKPILNIEIGIETLDKAPEQNEINTDLDSTGSFREKLPLDERVYDYEYIEPDSGLNDNLIPNDRGASFANIVQATVVETSARSVRDLSIGSKYLILQIMILYL